MGTQDTKRPEELSVRDAEPEDGDAIREVARRSMEASYSLGPSTIEAAVGQWFDDDALREHTDHRDHGVLVAEWDEEIVGVTELAYVEETGTGDVLWLHVDPDYRGEGIGRTLFAEASSWLQDASAEYVRGLVLANNAEGNAFYRDRGFERVGEREVEIDGDQFTEHIYHDERREQIEAVVDDEREVYVNRGDPDRGSLGPFYAVYTDPGCEELYSHQCSHCGTIASAMDSMGRIECSDCGNARKPTRWDAAYL